LLKRINKIEYNFLTVMKHITSVKRKFIENLFIFIGIFCIVSILGCRAVDDAPYAVQTGTVTDVDGNTYKTILIGEQWWMTENLKTTRFRNGIQIPLAQEDFEWQKAKPSYCIYENNAITPGLLYNFYVVSDPNIIAPYGWHVPTDDEWKKLELFLGMSATDVNKVNWRGTHEGEKLKIEGPLGWQVYGTVWGTNESGFSALAGSCRLFNGLWGIPGLKYTGFWWSASENEYNHTKAWYRYLDYKNANVFRYFGPKNYGCSIRCVKN
jgi:uncharacterized protein (TIGR02145 family)